MHYSPEKQINVWNSHYLIVSLLIIKYLHMTHITVNNPEVQNYAREKYAEGYAAGYKKALADARMRKMKKLAFQKDRFKRFVHFLYVLRD